MRPRTPCLATILALGACAEPYPLAPELAASVADAPYPALVPVERIRAQGPPATATPGAAAAIDARADALRARASSLRGPVIDAGTETRMRRGVDG